MMKSFFILTLCPLLLVAEKKPSSHSRISAVINVENTNDNGPGSLRQAIIQANQNPEEDIINFLPNVSGTISLNSRLPVIIYNTIMNGPGAEKLSISGQDQFRILETYNTTTPSEIRISGLTFKNGKGNAGAAIRNGGLCKIYLINCVFRNNISPNTGAGDGGALSNFLTAKMNIDNCSFFENSASTFGGAIYNLGSLDIRNSTLTANRAFNGAAIFNINQTGIATITNCTISGNVTSGGSGGGLFADLSSKTFVNNSTITLNSTSGIGSGGGLFAGTATVTLFSSIIAGNSTSVNGPDIQGKVISSGYNLLGNLQNSTGITDGVNSDRSGTPATPLNAMLGPLQNNGGPTLTHALLPGSPAIDAGDCNGITFDQRGVSRPYNGICDIGAFEVAPSMKVNLQQLVVFLGVATPADNGRLLDVKAEIFIGDSLAATNIRTNQRIAGHLNNNHGIKINLPVSVRDFSANPGDSIRIRISVRNADRFSVNTRLWHNKDSLAVNSRGFSRLMYSLDSSLPGYLYFREGFRLDTSPGSTAAYAGANASSAFVPFGTWTIRLSDLPDQQPRPSGGSSPEKENENSRTFSVVPNPAGLSPVFYFDNHGAENAFLEIMDMTGRIIATSNIRLTSRGMSIFREITLSKPGIYAARLTLRKNGLQVSRETTGFLVR